MIEAAFDGFRRRFQVALEAFEQGADIFLDHLKLIGDRNAIAVIINGDDGGRFQHADGVDRFPKQTFCGGCIADGCECDFVPVV